MAARTQADTEFLARELAAVRLALADVVTTEDLDDSLTRMAKLMADTRPERDALPGSLAPGSPSPDSPSPDSPSPGVTRGTGIAGLIQIPHLAGQPAGPNHQKI